MAVIALLTDFGPSEYTGAVKGVLLRGAPGAAIVDIAHDIAPQNVREGAWVLLGTYRWFPEGTVFLCVVDPGVGTERAAIAVKTGRYMFVGPDNGLLAPAVFDDGFVEARRLEVGQGASRTFHGRDVFAPAAARLAASGWDPAIGRPLAGIQRISFHLCGREGEVVRIDRFGNIITNLCPEPGRTWWRTRISAGELPERLPAFRTYAEAPEGELFVIENSYGTLEIACKNGSAAGRTGARAGARIVLE